VLIKFYARDAMLAWVLAMGLCVYACVRALKGKRLELSTPVSKQ